MDKRALLAELMFGSWSPLNFVLRPQGKHKLFVLAYHRIGYQAADYPFNRTILSATPEQFDRQLQFVKDHFNVVNFHDLDRILKKDGGISENTLVITFDDGYKDNATTAASLLQAHKLTATFYVTTHNIDTGALLWFDLLHYFIRNIPKGQYRLGEQQKMFDRTGDDARDFFFVGQYLREVSDTDRLHILQQLREWSTAPDPEQYRALADILTWDDVKAMANAGFEIGSHSCSHPHLYRLDRAGQLRELRESKATIERHIGREVVSFSYPTGGFDQITVECVKEAGYRFAAAYDEGVWPQDGNRFLIPRIHVEPEIMLSRFKGSLILPGLFLHGLRAGVSE